MTSLADRLGTALGEYVSAGGVRVEVKTNLGPAITLYDGSGGAGVADALGIKAALVVRGSSGQVLASYGDPPATNPALVAAFALAGAAIVAVLVTLIRRL